MPDIAEIQSELRAAKLDGWLFYDFRGRDPIATRILDLPEGMRTRRWYYFVPAKGAPRKLVHRIESPSLDTLPGEKLHYSAHEELDKNLAKILGRARTIAMQYSPKNAIPYVSNVDAGTVEMVRSLRRKVVSSADLVQRFEASWSPAQLESHLAAGKVIDRVVKEAFQQAGRAVRERRTLTEYDLKQWILQQYEAAGIVTDEGPDIAVNANSSDPHYQAGPGKSSPIREGDLLLLDVWGKMKAPASVYYDITWTGFLGAAVPEKHAKIFAIVREARDRAVAFVKDGIATGKSIAGWQVDRVARDIITRAGYGKYFFHRTGHSIGERVHGNGANIDGLETKDVRRIIPRTCFSIEPGIYLPDFGIRSEVNVYVDGHEARVTGDIQTGVLPLLA